MLEPQTLLSSKTDQHRNSTYTDNVGAIHPPTHTSTHPHTHTHTQSDTRKETAHHRNNSTYVDMSQSCTPSSKSHELYHFKDII